MYESNSCSNTYAWPQSLKRHIKDKHNAKDDKTVSYEKDVTSPNSIFSDNTIPDKEHIDLGKSEDDDNLIDSTKSSTNASTTEDNWDDIY